MRLLDNLVETATALQKQTYVPSRSLAFVACRPKAREIHAADFAECERMGRLLSLTYPQYRRLGSAMRRAGLAWLYVAEEGYLPGGMKRRVLRYRSVGCPLVIPAGTCCAAGTRVLPTGSFSRGRPAVARRGSWKPRAVGAHKRLDAVSDARPCGAVRPPGCALRLPRTTGPRFALLGRQRWNRPPAAWQGLLPKVSQTVVPEKQA